MILPMYAAMYSDLSCNTLHIFACIHMLILTKFCISWNINLMMFFLGYLVRLHKPINEKNRIYFGVLYKNKSNSNKIKTIKFEQSNGICYFTLEFLIIGLTKAP